MTYRWEGLVWRTAGRGNGMFRSRGAPPTRFCVCVCVWVRRYVTLCYVILVHSACDSLCYIRLGRLADRIIKTFLGWPEQSHSYLYDNLTFITNTPFSQTSLWCPSLDAVNITH